MIKKIIIAIFVLFVCGGVFAKKPNVTSAFITEKVMAAAAKNPFGNFLNYKVEGLCYWLKPGYPPKITTTLKVNHFLPDAIITVYTGYKKNPWVEANSVIDPAMKAIGDESYRITDHTTPSNERFAGAGDSMEQFKEVDIVGNPALTPFYSLPFALIHSVVTPLVPYFSSLADAYFWTSPEWEDLLNPEYLIPGIRTEGSLLDQWGNIYPRIGYLNQLGDYKAAAVIALRAADIITQNGMFRVHIPMQSQSCGQHCRVWPSHENDFKNVKFQEIYPEAKTTAKANFGAFDLLKPTAYNQSQYSKGDGTYVWVMWRHYEGCIQGQGKFIGETSW